MNYLLIFTKYTFVYVYALKIFTCINIAEKKIFCGLQKKQRFNVECSEELLRTYICHTNVYVHLKLHLFGIDLYNAESTN